MSLILIPNPQRRPTLAKMKRMPRAAPCPSCESEAVEAFSTGDGHTVRCCDCGLSLSGRTFPTQFLDEHTKRLAKARREFWLDTAKREGQVMLIQRWNKLPRPDSEDA